MTSLAAGWNWWLEGLTEAVGLHQARWRANQRVRLVPGAGGYQIVSASGGRSAEVVRFEPGADGRARLVPTSGAAHLRNKSVELVLDAGEILVRTLDPLPAESSGYVDGIVQHNLERITPWRAGDIVHAYRVTAAGPSDPRLIVTVVATARPLLASRIEALERCGITELQVLAPANGSDADAALIDVTDTDTRTQARAGLRRRVKRSLMCMAAIGAITCSTLAWLITQADKRLEHIAATVSQQRSALLGSPSGSRQARDAQAIWRKKTEATSAVLTLEALAAALPDDTSLTELRIEENRVRVTGVSRNVTALVPLIEQTRGFADARFFAPTIRLPDGQGNQFHLEAKISTGGKGSP